MKSCPKTISGKHNFLDPSCKEILHENVDKIGSIYGREVPVCRFCGIIDDRPTKGGKK